MNPAQSLVLHRYQRVAGTHPVRAAIMPGRSGSRAGTCTIRTAVPFVPVLLYGDPVSGVARRGLPQCVRLGERTRAHDRPRTPVSHAATILPPPSLASDAGIDQLVEMEAARGCLELDARTFGARSARWNSSGVVILCASAFASNSAKSSFTLVTTQSGLRRNGQCI
jgi:hypothetical protein